MRLSVWRNVLFKFMLENMLKFVGCMMFLPVVLLVLLGLTECMEEDAERERFDPYSGATPEHPVWEEDAERFEVACRVREKF